MTVEQRQINTNLVSGGISTTLITELRNSIKAGNVINASDLNSIASMINAANGHYHSYTDISQKATYGNNGDRTTYSTTRNSGTADSTIDCTETVASGDSITPTMHNALKTSVNKLRSHTHSAYDATTK